MRLKINGDWAQYESPMTISQLLGTLKLEPRRVAVELNGTLVPRARHDQTALADQDSLEIVTLVGGG